MVTQAQLEANKHNSLKAGVKTDSGKAISKYNSVRHGVLRKTLIATEKDEAEALRAELLEEYQPQAMTEYILIESMILAYMRKIRAIQAEKAYLSDGHFPWVRYDRQSEEVSQIDADSYSILDTRFMRYSTACDRQFYFALHELQRIQARRNGQGLSSLAVDVLGNPEI